MNTITLTDEELELLFQTLKDRQDREFHFTNRKISSDMCWAALGEKIAAQSLKQFPAS